MERISKMWRSGLAMLLALCLLISACPVTAFAAEEEINYVSLGDSMTNGYCFTGYEQGNHTNDIASGDGMYGDTAYPNQFASWLENETGKKVDHFKGAVSAMRAEELNYLLGGRSKPTDGWAGEVENYANANYDVLIPLYQEKVAEADVITMGIGNAAFGAYMVQYFTDLVGVMGGEPGVSEDDYVNLEKALEVLEPAQKEVIMSAYNQMMAKAAPYIPANVGPLDVQGLLDMMAYIGVGFILNYEGALDQIVALNPDVDVVLLGLMNTTYGMTITGEGFDPIPIGDIVGILFDSLNAYIAALPTVKQATGEWAEANFYYTNMSNPEFIVQVFDDMWENDWKEGVDEYKGLSAATVRDRTIAAYNEAIVPMICGMFELNENVLKVTLDDVKAGCEWQSYETWAEFNPAASKLDTATEYGVDVPGSFFTGKPEDFKKLSVAIYLAIEKGLAKSVDTMGISLDGLLKIAGDMSTVFGGLDVSGLLSIESRMNDILTDAGNALPGLISAYEFAKRSGADAETIKNAKDALDAKVEEINEAIAEVREETSGAATYEMFADFFTDEDLKSLCKVFAMFKVGNGMSVHPTPAAHNKFAANVIAAYKDKATAKDETIKNVNVALSALKGFLEEYGPEAAEQAYQYLQENGYIDMARTEIEELVKYLNENKDALVEEMIPMIEAAIEALEAQNEELKAVLRSLKAELEALNAELEKASGEAAEQIKQAIAQIEAAIAEIEALIAQVNKQIAELNAAVEELIEAAKAIAEQVEVAIENAEALAESIVALVETLKETGTASVEAIAAAVEQARKTVLLAAETLEQAIELVTTQVADAVAMAEKITEQITALYQDVTSTLDEIIAKLPSDVQGAIKGAAEEIQKALDEAIAGVNADLQKAIDELKATIGAEIDAKKAELEALLDKIDAHVEEKAAGIKAAAEAQIAALKAEAEAKIAEINKKLEAEIAKLEAAANAQIDEIKGQIEALKAQAEAQIAKIKAEVEAQIAAIEAIIAEKEAQLKDLYAQLENASEEMKAEILKQIAQVEAEIAKLEAQIEALKAQAEAQIAKVKAEVEALNAKIQAIVADTQAKIEDLKAQAEAQIETVKSQLKAAVEKINADLKAKIDAIRAEVEATYANAVAALEKAIADLEEKLNAEIAKLKAQAEAQIAQLKAAAEAELEKLNALGQAAADVVNGIIEQVQDQLNTVNETVKAMMNSSVEEAAKLAEKLAEDLKGLGEEALNALVDELNEVLYDAFVKATTADLGLNEESTYIALGDGTAAPESYVEMLGEKLKAEYGVENIVNYAKDGNTVGDEIKAIADREGIADADLITIGFGNVTLVENAFNNAMKDEPASYNWVELVGEELVPYVQDALADIYAEIAAAGLDEETTEMLNIMVEGIAYGAVEYAIELPALINAIRAVNTDAVVIIVGQYNPMDGVVLEFGGMFGAPLVTLDIADYINYLVDGVAAHGIAYSMITGDAIFVAAPQVDTDNTDMSWGLKDLMQFMVYGFGVLNPSESGDGYITNQILEALNISKIEVKPEEPVKPVNPFVDVPEGAFYYDAVMWAVDLGITTGTQDGTTFEPNSGCTRAHVATFLWRAAGCPEPESTVMPFKDVAEGKFYTTAVLWAAENGITNGTGDGTTFEPNATCTRGQIVTMLARYLKGEPTGNDNPFKDVPANAYYTNPVLWAVENGITNGTQDGTTFEPNSPCTRGHIVTFLYRALNK